MPKGEEEKSKPLSSIEDLTKNNDNKGGVAQAQVPPVNQNINQNFINIFSDALKKMQQKYPSLGKILTSERIT